MVFFAALCYSAASWVACEQIQLYLELYRLHLSAREVMLLLPSANPL